MRKPSNSIWLCVAILVAVSSSVRGANYDCASLDECIGLLPKIAKANGQHDPAAFKSREAWIHKLDSFDGAIPRLVAMLADPDDDVANLAAEALRDADSIDPAFLPQIIAGLDRGLGWLPPALGRMPSDAAAREAVARYLVSESAPQNQEAYAVILSGKRAVPFIVQAARCVPDCRKDDQYLLGSVLREMDPEARRAAAPGLMAIASDDVVPRDVAAEALEMISDLQEAGQSVELDLLALHERRHDLAGAVEDALVGIRAKSTGSIFAARLERAPSVDTLAELQGAGRVGRDAGPVVERLLQSRDADVRAAAALTLGYIGYTPSVGKLIPLVDDPTDVRLDWAAVDALARLADPLALRTLQRASEAHWYPPVRTAALGALEHILNPKANARVASETSIPFRVFEYEYFRLDSCKNPLVKRRDPNDAEKLYASSDAPRIEKLAFDTEVLSYGPAEEPKMTGGQPAKVIEMTPDNIVEHRTPTRQVPKVALRVGDGWLVGSNRGEWGGELMYLPAKGMPQKIAAENVEDIYRLGDRLIATTGLAHITLNYGSVLELVREQDGTWSASTWRRLPGAPTSSWFVDTGELLINTVGGGSVLVARDGSMRMVPCKDQQATRTK